MFKLLYIVGAHVGAMILRDIADALDKYQKVSGSGQAHAVTLVDHNGDVVAKYGSTEGLDKRVPLENIVETSTEIVSGAAALHTAMSDAIDMITGHTGQAVKEIDTKKVEAEKVITDAANAQIRSIDKHAATVSSNIEAAQIEKSKQSK